MLLSTKVILCAYLIVAVFEVGGHWCVAKGKSRLAISLRDTYSHTASGNGKSYVAGWVDVIVPSTLLGIIVGTSAARCSTARIAFWVILLSICIIALLPVYSSFFPDGEAVKLWMAPGTRKLTLGDAIKPIMKALLCCGVFAYGSRDMLLQMRA